MLQFLEKLVILLSKAGFGLFVIVTIGLLVLIFKDEGLRGISSLIISDLARLLYKMRYMIPIFLILAAAVSHLADRHPETVRKMARGEYGTVAMVSLSMVMPGMAGGEQLQNAQNDPKTDKAKVLLCLVGMMGLNITMFMFRAALIGPELTLIWVGMGSWLLFQVWLGGKLWSCWFT